MDRDTVLAAALGAAVVTACTPSSGPDPAPPSPTPSPPPEDPDAAVLRRWLDTERRLAGRYAAQARRYAALSALRGNHRLRADAVADHLRVRGLAVPAPAPGSPLRGEPAAVLRALARAERDAAAAYVATLARVADPKVVALGAQLAAGARQHAVVLGTVRP